MVMNNSSNKPPHYAIYVANPTDSISQALTTAAQSKRGTLPNIKVERKTGQTIGTNISQFLAKLWRLVNDAETDTHICWSEDGYSFIVRDQAKFSMELLPKYFKHHNFSSFVRQLNMYGFRKVLNTEHGGLRCVRDDWQFSNKNFCRDRPELLEFVKRKPSQIIPGTLHHHSTKNVDYTSLKKVVSEVNRAREDNAQLHQSFEKLREENVKLYDKVEDLNEKNTHQTIVIQKILHFLWRLVDKQNSLASKRPQMMLENGEPQDDPPWQVSPSHSPSRQLGDQVNKVENNLQSIQNLLSQSLHFDPDFVNDLFEHNTEYLSPAQSPAPSGYSSAPTSPGPSGVNTASPADNFSVQVEQYVEGVVPSSMNMASPSYIQHPISPHHSPVLRRSPARSPANSPHVTPVHSPHVSPAHSPLHLSPHCASPHVSPHVSPCPSPYMNQQRLSPIQVNYQRMGPVLSPHSSPAAYQRPPIQGQGSPVPQLPQYQQQQCKLSPRHYNSYTQPAPEVNNMDHVVKKPKLSSYSQYITWEDEEDEEEDEVKIDPSSFFLSNNPS